MNTVSSPLSFSIPLNHIYNKYNDGNVFVTDIYNSYNNAYSGLSTTTKSSRFTHIKIAKTVDSNNKNALVKYINEKYPGLKENGLIGDLSKVKQVSGIENDKGDDTVFIPVSGYYAYNISNTYTNMLFFDTPLLINITTHGNDTQIYI